MIRLEKVAKSYDGGESFAVRDVSLEIAAGEFVCLLGESGCGKTTTLKMMNRLNDLTEGTIHVDGQDIMEQDPVVLRRHIGYVFQGLGLFPHMTVGENIAVVPGLLGWARDEMAARVDELLQLVNLAPDEFLDRFPGQLSGGQQQRIGVARALAARPKIMLMDEPFGALDPVTRDNIQEEYRKIHDRLGLTTVMVTHDMTEALILGDRIVVMQDGRMVQVGTPDDLLNRPEDDTVRALMETPKKQAERVETLIRGEGSDE